MNQRIMEELIWKFIDNDCTKEEIERVKILLESDPHFNRMFIEISALDKLLLGTANVPMSAAFRSKLEQTIVKNAITEPQIISADVISTQWIAALTIVAMGVLIYVLNFNTGSSSIIPDIPLPDAKVMQMISLVTTGFVMLVLIDWILKVFHKQKISFILA